MPEYKANEEMLVNQDDKMSETTNLETITKKAANILYAYIYIYQECRSWKIR